MRAVRDRRVLGPATDALLKGLRALEGEVRALREELETKNQEARVARAAAIVNAKRASEPRSRANDAPPCHSRAQEEAIAAMEVAVERHPIVIAFKVFTLVLTVSVVWAVAGSMQKLAVFFIMLVVSSDRSWAWPVLYACSPLLAAVIFYVLTKMAPYIYRVTAALVIHRNPTVAAGISPVVLGTVLAAYFSTGALTPISTVPRDVVRRALAARVERRPLHASA